MKYIEEAKTATFYRKDQNIFNEGMKPHGVYCLSEGKVKIYKIGIDGKEQIVRFVTPGELLGIRALISGQTYSATASTLEDSLVCYIEKRAFLKMTVKYPEISHCLMISLSHLLEDAENKLTSLAQKGVRERLAETLLALNSVFQSEQNGSEDPKAIIKLSRTDLANIVGTATETVIRLLSEFKESKLVEVNGRKITLMDVEGLKRIGKIFN
jgi:CRP/FNR family transcriptional regulator